MDIVQLLDIPSDLSTFLTDQDISRLSRSSSAVRRNLVRDLEMRRKELERFLSESNIAIGVYYAYDYEKQKVLDYFGYCALGDFTRSGMNSFIKEKGIDIDTQLGKLTELKSNNIDTHFGEFYKYSLEMYSADLLLKLAKLLYRNRGKKVTVDFDRQICHYNSIVSVSDDDETVSIMQSENNTFLLDLPVILVKPLL